MTMADLDGLRTTLAAQRTTSDAASRALFVEQERLARLERAARELDRRIDPTNRADRQTRDDLNRAIAESRALASRLGAAKDGALADLKGTYASLEPLTDPRRAIGGLNAGFPILLFPVRLETRFVTRDQGRQLLVRIYPDDCLVDSFEPDLSEAEVTNLRRYWCETFSAGGDEPLERAAWRTLCAAHGAGRALYLIGQYAPLAGSDPVPARASAAEIILTIPVDAAIADATERGRIADYWTATWRARHDEAAFATLSGLVGAARAEEIRATIVPSNRQEPPQAGVDRATATVKVVFVVLTPGDQAAVKRQSWTRPPSAALLPERFVLIADSGAEHVELLGGMVTQPLAVGPDPLAQGAEQFQPAGADITVPPALQWMTDFEAAQRAGMGFRVDLTPRQAQLGFDRLYVVGLRLASDEQAGRKALEQLLQDHLRSQSGFAILPQGTPTNNTEDGPSGWTRVQEADALFAQSRAAQADLDLFDPAAIDPYEKKDGLVLAEALGIDADALQHVPGAEATDQAEARAMNAALWPATLGYWMDTQMRPVFSDDSIARTRAHFIDRVSGRGRMPALRIGRQPYGVLATTAFSRLTWLDAPGARPSPHQTFLRRLRDVLRALDEAFWSRFAATVPHVGQPTADPQQQLLDIIGLHASSVDFHLQVVDSADRIWNEAAFRLRNRALLRSSMEQLMLAGTDLLRSLGYAGPAPEVVQKFVASVEGPMTRPVIDAAPLSETIGLSICTDDNKNYIQWCREKAAAAFDDLRQQAGFSDGRTPNALFYHVLRHALQLGYYDAAVGLHGATGAISPDQVAATYREPSFVHVAAGEVSESRYRLLYEKNAAITGNATTMVAEFIPVWLQSAGRSSTLADQLAALPVLETVPTARLERAFAEHVDLCGYRWDAWMLSLVQERLSTMRRPGGAEAPRREGVYLGAYGWIEDLKPDTAPLLPVSLPDDLRAIFDTPGQPALQRDPANGGHVLAPSLNHAVTAAILRNGYLNNASPAQPTLFAVDLSSARVRVARQFLEGIRNGQSLGALLGYQFERRLHDRHDEAEVDTFIYQVRKAFPLAAKRIADSVDDAAADTAIENIEARNVCDGLLLIEHVRTAANKTYPWDTDLDRGTSGQEAIINQEVAALFDIQDAIADVAIAESVHQATTGNSERAAATMDAYAKSTFPPEPDVVRTPRSGTTLTHRVAVHLPVDAVAGAGATPRAQAEPAVDRWLGDILPPMPDLAVHVEYANAAGDTTPHVVDVTMAALGLRPIDLIYLVDPDRDQAMADLDDRIAQHVITTAGLCPDASVQIGYTDVVSGTKKTAFEAAPLVVGLRNLLLNARPLKPSDAAMESEASSDLNGGLTVPAAQIAAARASVDSLRQDAAALAATLTPLADPAAAFAAIVAGADAALSAFFAIQHRAGLCGVSLSGAGHAMRSVRDWFGLVRSKAHDVVAFWNGKLADCDAGIAEAANPANPESVRVQAMVRAERAVSTAYTTPPPGTAAALLPTVTTKRAAFLTVKAQIEAVEGSTATTIGALWAVWAATFAPRASHDITVLDATAEEQQLRVLVAEMRQQLAGLVRELETRLGKGDDLIADAASAGAEPRAKLLQDAAAAFLGDGYHVVPRFTLAADQANEWQNAFDDRASLLTHASTLHDFPADDWLYGVARVRARVHDLEKVMHLAAAFERSEPVLTPLQFPFRSGEPWLAMELPATFDLAAAGEHLLYSALYPGAVFDKAAAAHGGLLLDEWTETIPGTRETAGLTFNYDRPNCEPPQSLLLITPASAGNEWQWLDVASAIPETFALARKRAAEPRDINATPLARFLPATLMAFTSSGISIGSQMHRADLVFASRNG